MQNLNIAAPRQGISLAQIPRRTAEEVGRFVSTGSNKENRAVEVANQIFEQAVVYGSSDVHVSIDEFDGLTVRLRKNGDLQTLENDLSPEEAKIVKTKICAKSKLDDQQRLEPQDGRMMLFFGGRRIDVRVAVAPTVSGYTVICRLLDSSNSNINLDALEMPLLVKRTLKRIASNPDGMVLFSGPTGSGKTTSLYALLQFLNQERTHIITIENPVEYTIAEFTQMDVNMHLSFAAAMRAALRMDPDIIMVGEIRDEESAQIAARAGESGHMVLSTVHANSAAEIVTRLLKLGVRGFEMGPLLSVLIAQRLVKRISDDAHIEWTAPNDIEKVWLTERSLFIPGMKLPRVKDSDLVGRVPLVEMIEITPDIKKIIEEEGGKSNVINAIVDAACKQPQFETLPQAGVRLALAGKTTLEVVMRAIKEMSYIPPSQRFDQILLSQNKITHTDIENAWIEVFNQRDLGVVEGLDQALVRLGMASESDVQNAIADSGGGLV